MPPRKKSFLKIITPQIMVRITVIAFFVVTAVLARNGWKHVSAGWDTWCGLLFLMLAGGLIAGMCVAFAPVRKDKDIVARFVLTSVLWGSILYLAVFVTMPFLPLASHQILGSWGAGMTALVMVFIVLLIRQADDRFGSATMAMLVFGVISALSVRDTLPSGSMTLPHWLLISAFLTAGCIADSSSRLKRWIQGAMIGLGWAGVLYSFANCFMETGLRYGPGDAFTAIIASSIGGIVAAAVLNMESGKKG